jgi:hypothetical protein
MVLRHPGGIKAAMFGMHDLRYGEAIALGRIRPIEEASKKAEAYRRLRCGHVITVTATLRPVGPRTGRHNQSKEPQRRSSAGREQQTVGRLELAVPVAPDKWIGAPYDPSSFI